MSWVNVGAIKQAANPYGFVLPIFARDGDQQTRYVQIVDHSSITFLPVALGEDSIVTWPRKDIPEASHSPIYAFCARGIDPLIGPLSQLKAQLKGLLDSDLLPESVRLQIAILVQQRDAISAYRKSFLSFLSNRVTKECRESFINSSIREVAWDLLERAAKGDEKRRAIRRNRHNLDFFLGTDGRIEFSNFSHTLSFSNDDIDDIKRQLVKEFADLLPTHVHVQTASPTADDHRVLSVIQKTRHLSRQEARIAALLDAILKTRDADFSRMLLGQYWDRAQFASRAVRVLQTELEKVDYHPSEAEAVIASQIRRFVSLCFWTLQGIFLRELAEKLAPYSLISRSIRRVVAGSRSKPIIQNTERILSILDRSLPASSPDGRAPPLF